MPSIKVYKMDGSEAGTMKLSDKVFGAEYNEAPYRHFQWLSINFLLKFF